MRWLWYRLIYAFLWLLARLARWFPRLRAPGWLPLAGDIDGRTFAPPVAIRDDELGSSMAVPAVLKIVIDGSRGTAVPSALAPVATRLFEGKPPFTFNVCFSCGSSAMFQPGVYGDPSSHWFNVFAGYYEIDVAKSAWGRPFGYTRDGVPLEKEVAALGSADWNYFSNLMYGVPLAIVEGDDQPNATFEAIETVAIGERRWHLLRAHGMTAASAYLSRADEGALVDTVPGLTDVWRVAFGLPFVGDGDTSFFKTEMSAALFACFVEDGDTYRTFLFGGTVNDTWAGSDPARIATNRRFLAVQVEVVKALIARDFPHLGFAPTSRAA